MSKRLERLWPYLTLVGVWALFFWRFAAPPSDRVAYPAGDFTETFGVFRDIVYRALLAGRFPLWADCLWSGYPLHADPQAALFYPPTWLIFLILRVQNWGHFPIEALTAEVALHYLFLSFFLFLFLSSLSLRRSAAVLGAVVFTYGGYLTGSPPLQTATLEVNTWLPLALLFVGKLVQTRQPRHLALTALMLTLSFLAGHPQTFVYIALLVGAYFAFRAHQVGWSLGVFVGWGVALMGLTVGLSAAQLFPSVHFILNSTRASVAFEQAGHGFPFADVLQFFLTGFVSLWQPLYVGLLPLGLTAYACARRSAEIRFWAGTALAALLLSFGTKAVAYDVAYWLIPGYRLFREQERLALVVSVALAVLAAFGAHHMLGSLSRHARWALCRVERAAGVVFLISIGILTVAMFLARMGLDPSDWRKFPERAGVMMFAAGLAWLVLRARMRLPFLRRWWPALCVSVVILDLFAANRPLNVTRAFQPFAPNPLVEPIAATAGFFRVQDDFQLPGHAGCAYGYRAIEGVTPYQIATYKRLLERTPEPLRWAWLGVEYLVSWRAEVWDQSGQSASQVVAQGTVPDSKGNVTTVHRLTHEPRRAWLVHRAEVIADDEALYGRLEEGPGSDAFGIAFVSGAVEVSPGNDRDRVAVTLDAPGHVRLETASEGAAVLVLGEAHFSGWRARVDDQPATLLRVNGALMGVALPAGVHTVEFAYQPLVLFGGGIISALAWLLTLGLLFSNRRFYVA